MCLSGDGRGHQEQTHSRSLTSSGGHCKDRGKDSDGSLDFGLQELERSSGIEWSSLESIVFCLLENGHFF